MALPFPLGGIGQSVVFRLRMLPSPAMTDCSLYPCQGGWPFPWGYGAAHEPGPAQTAKGDLAISDG
jgi:hypothetical protein